MALGQPVQWDGDGSCNGAASVGGEREYEEALRMRKRKVPVLVFVRPGLTPRLRPEHF